MHIPDGLMLPLIMAIGWMIAIIVLALSARKVKALIPDDKIPTMAVLAAGIFVAQMLNFPIIGGTSGHILGATIAVAIVGPWAAVLVMSIVIIVQGLMFGDGGILSMGLNLTNMAVIGVSVSYLILKITYKMRAEASIFIASGIAVFTAAIFCGLELATSYALAPGQYGIIWSISIPTMTGLHAIIAIGEAIISASVIAYLVHVSPDIIHSFDQKKEATPQ